MLSRDFVPIARECAYRASAGKPLWLVDWCGDRRYALLVLHQLLRAEPSRQGPGERRNLVKAGRHSMPLTRGSIVGYDSERMAFKFTMLNGDETINCQISDAALDELVGTTGSLYTVRQAQFSANREKIESIASDIFDTSGPVPGSVVRIFSKHILK
jgi:hypothetical protein